jgi:hypothetical protein
MQLGPDEARDWKSEFTNFFNEMEESLAQARKAFGIVAVGEVANAKVDAWAEGVRRAADRGKMSYMAVAPIKEGQAVVEVGLTLAEIEVLDSFSKAYGALRALPDFDHAVEGELAAALHVFQDHVAIRVARRINPGFWRAAR